MELVKEAIILQRKKKRQKQEEKEKIFNGEDLTLMKQMQGH